MSKRGAPAWECLGALGSAGDDVRMVTRSVADATIATELLVAAGQEVGPEERGSTACSSTARGNALGFGRAPATMPVMTDEAGAALLDKLMALRQHQHDGKRSPHKPLLVLMALGELAASGSSAMAWSAIEGRLAALISEFGPPSSTGAAQSAAYPF